VAPYARTKMATPGSDEFKRERRDRITSDSAARENVILLINRMRETFDAMVPTWRPRLRLLLHARTLIKRLPPINGYEPLLIADGHTPLMARFFAAATLMSGKQMLAERRGERDLARAICELAKVRSQSTLVISRRAGVLAKVLALPRVDIPLWRAWRKANIPDAFSELEKVVARSIERDAEACQRLIELTTALRPHLCDPRGRIPTVESCTHEAFLILREKGAYTYSPDAEDFSDESTHATRLALGVPDFSPLAAHRRLKRRA
jgi:hypothetical protein